MASAKNAKACVSTIIGQISSVGEMAINTATLIATYCSSLSTTATTSSGTKAAKVISHYIKLQKFFKSSKGVKKLLEKAWNNIPQIAKFPLKI